MPDSDCYACLVVTAGAVSISLSFLFGSNSPLKAVVYLLRRVKGSQNSCRDDGRPVTVTLLSALCSETRFLQGLGAKPNDSADFVPQCDFYAHPLR